jgi:TolB protein
MVKSRLFSTHRIRKVIWTTLWLGPLVIGQSLFSLQAWGQITIEIDRFSMKKFNIAILEFQNLTTHSNSPELSAVLPKVISNDLDLSGYFTPMDKESFLEEGDSMSREEVSMRNYSVIGADFLITGRYSVIGRVLEVEARLHDVFSGRQIKKPIKRVGKAESYRSLMHSIGNEIIHELIGYEGIFLTKLAFVSTSTGHKEVYVSDYDGYNVQQLTFDESIALFPRWSPSGDKIAFYSYKERTPKLYLTNYTSGKVRTILNRKGLYSGASWAPDGKKLAFTLSQEGNPDIFTVDIDGETVTRVTKGWGINTSATFSPDGKKIVFVSDRSGSPQIYVRTLESGREERITFQGTYNQSPSWSSLDRIAFSSYEEGRHNIYTMDSDGRNLRKLTEDQNDNEDPCWSPDGRYIVFSSNRAGGYHLYIMNANGQNQRRITFMKGEQTLPSWAAY